MLEEADVSLYWLEVSKEAELIKPEQTDALIKEANELVSIFISANITAKRNMENLNPQISKSQNQK